MVKPILFSTPMVQAILDGRKTMTRRVIASKNCPTLYPISKIFSDPIGAMYVGGIIRPRYQPGDVLWVRETWCDTEKHFGRGVQPRYFYAANKTPTSEEYRKDFGIPWRPSIFMPREAARLYLKVTDLRAERVQDIFEEPPGPNNPIVKEGFSYGCDFIATWENLNAKRGFGWKTNPWVWVISFEKTGKPEEA